MREIIENTLFAFIILAILFPAVVREPDAEYQRLVKHYPKMKAEWFHELYGACKHHNVDIDNMCAIIQEESGWTPGAVSSAGAIGLCQIMPFHSGNPAELYIPEVNIAYGVRYWEYCMDVARGDQAIAIIYYNAGPNSIVEDYYNSKYWVCILYRSSFTRTMKDI